PKAVVACVDWKRTTATRLEISGNYRFRIGGKGGPCFGITPELCGRGSVGACRNDNLCSTGYECVLVDLDGASALDLPASLSIEGNTPETAANSASPTAKMAANPAPTNLLDRPGRTVEVTW